MRTIPAFHTGVSICLFLGISHNAVVGQQQFEGVIETRNTTIDEYGTQQEFTMSMFIKQDMVTIKNSAIGTTPATTMIYRGDQQVVWMLDEENTSYFEIRKDENPEEVHATPGENKEPPAIRKTGKRKQVAGYACEQIIVIDGDQETELWATKSLAPLHGVISKVLGDDDIDSGWEDTIMKMGYYPLIAVTKVGGKVLESQETTKIEKKSLPQGIFDLPAGYEKQSMYDLMK